jgi:propanol-preferring alcohol dehydrogenase
MRLSRARPVEQRPLELVELPPPSADAGQVRLRVEACGICRTDLHIIEGELSIPKLPLVPGHQIVGIVDQVGTGIRRVRRGDRLGVSWVASTCGACAFCQQGRENLCDAGRFTGLHVDGGYAEFVVASEDFTYPLPASVTPVHAAPLLCAGVIGFRALRLSKIKPGGRLGLYGFGGSAHIAIQVAVHWGCEVYVFTRGEAHRALATQLGAYWTGRAEDSPPRLLDGAVIFAPVGGLVAEALRALAKGGTVAIAGITMTPITGFEYGLLYHERAIVSVANSTRQDALDLLALAAEIPIRTEVETFPLEEANNALALLRQSRLRGAGVLAIS